MIAPEELRGFADFVADPDSLDWGPREIWAIEEFFDVRI